MTPFSISDEVAQAVVQGRPVVALETAVISHGLPRPEGLAVYQEMLAAVRDAGGVPAPVGLVGGQVRVGLDAAQVRAVATDAGAWKVGLADLPVAAAQGASGGTTVAATLWAACRAGIEVFATGGIGGVHRHLAQHLDVSGDLAALARYGGCVVCSGAKAVLDLPKTLEALETLGVCVVGFRTGELPAFVCRSSGLALRHRVEHSSAAAAVVRARNALGLAASVLLVQPVDPAVAVSPAVLEGALEQAEQQAVRDGVRGKELTPHLLAAAAAATAGATVAANRALLVDNARLAAEVAGELAPRHAPPGMPDQTG